MAQYEEGILTEAFMGWDPEESEDSPVSPHRSGEKPFGPPEVPEGT